MHGDEEAKPLILLAHTTGKVNGLLIEASHVLDRIEAAVKFWLGKVVHPDHSVGGRHDVVHLELLHSTGR